MFAFDVTKIDDYQDALDEEFQSEFIHYMDEDWSRYDETNPAHNYGVLDALFCGFEVPFEYPTAPSKEWVVYLLGVYTEACGDRDHSFCGLEYIASRPDFVQYKNEIYDGIPIGAHMIDCINTLSEFIHDDLANQQYEIDVEHVDKLLSKLRAMWK